MSGADEIGPIVSASPIIAVLTIGAVEDAIPLAEALVAGGVRAIEVTLRTPAALRAIRAIASEVPEALVGAGTISRVEDFAEARSAGALFAVSPGATPLLLSAGRQSGLPYLPGVMTPSEVMVAVEHGYHTLKFFPAASAGGTAMLKALHGPFASVRFCPTGGITLENAQSYLDLPNVVCIGGAWIAPADAVMKRDWARVTKEAQRSVQVLRSRS